MKLLISQTASLMRYSRLIVVQVGTPWVESRSIHQSPVTFRTKPTDPRANLVKRGGKLELAQGERPLVRPGVNSGFEAPAPQGSSKTWRRRSNVTRSG